MLFDSLNWKGHGRLSFWSIPSKFSENVYFLKMLKCYLYHILLTLMVSILKKLQTRSSPFYCSLWINSFLCCYTNGTSINKKFICAVNVLFESNWYATCNRCLQNLLDFTGRYFFLWKCVRGKLIFLFHHPYFFSFLF